MTVIKGEVWRLYGLDVRSPLPLSRSRSAASTPTVTIEVHDPCPTPEGLAGRLLGECRVDGQLLEAAYDVDGAVYVLFPGNLVARFDTGRAVCEITPDPSADPAVVRRLVAVPVLATWMILTDRPVLHASAVQIGDTAAVFVGNTGSGKSTIAAALVGAGALAITDDLCRLAEHDDGWVCYPDVGQLRLRAGSAALATMFNSEVVAPVDGRLTVSVPTAELPVPVGAVVFPRISREAPQMAATRLRGTRAVLALLEHPRMASLLGDEFSPALFRFGSRLVAQVPTWELVVPWAAVTPGLGGELLAVVSGTLNHAERPPE